jgi:ribosomal peptide maturation radical SAM protein 1
MADVCLVTMPFTPVSTPALGVSLLKAALVRSGIRADVHYGAFDFFRVVNADVWPVLALYDYNFIATNAQLGDLLFTPLLWDTSGTEVERALSNLAVHRNYLFAPGELETTVERLRRCAARIPQLIEQTMASRDWTRYRVVGVSSTFSQNIASLVFARELRRCHPDVHIVFGGANCDGDMGRQLLASFPWVDGVLQGEAELSFPAYVRRVLAGQNTADVPGALFRENSCVVGRHHAIPVPDLNESPQPDFRDYFAQLPPALSDPANRREISLPIETSRGCWWGAVQHCTFCGLNPATMTFRAKTPERAVAEFHRLRDEYGDYKITAVDNIISMKYFEAVLPLIENDGLEIFYETKANLTEKQVRRLARSGVRSIQPGIEGFSSEILTLMKKGVRGYQNLELLKWCVIYDVRLMWFYLYRFPNEPHQPYFRDAVRMRRWFHLPPPRNPNPVVIDRYSPLYTNREAVGLRNLRPSGYAPLCYRGLTTEEQLRICYHFDADLPQGDDLPYEIPLWETITDWNRAYAAGACLYQFFTAASTLIVDTRRERSRSFLLTGDAHRIYQVLRTARPRPIIAEQLAAAPVEAESFLDLELAYLGGLLGAETIEATADSGNVDRFLEHLDREWLAELIDGRWLALAVDCTAPETAAKFGLEKFLRVLDPAEIRPTRYATDEELVSLLEKMPLAI